MGEHDTRDCPRCMAHTLHYTGGTVVEDDDDWGYRLYYHEMKCDSCGLVTIDGIPYRKEPF